MRHFANSPPSSNRAASKVHELFRCMAHLYYGLNCSIVEHRLACPTYLKKSRKTNLKHVYSMMGDRCTKRKLSLSITRPSLSYRWKAIVKKTFSVSVSDKEAVRFPRSRDLSHLDATSGPFKPCLSVVAQSFENTSALPTTKPTTMTSF